MRADFYEYFFINLKITIKQNIMQAQATKNNDDLKFYKRLSALVEILRTETLKFLEEHR